MEFLFKVVVTKRNINGVIRGIFEIVFRTLKFTTFFLYFCYFCRVYFGRKSDKFEGSSYNLKNRSDDAISIPLITQNDFQWDILFSQ